VPLSKGRAEPVVADESFDDLLALGIDWRTNNLIIPPIDAADALESITAEDPKHVYVPSPVFAPSFELVRPPNPFDPRAVGWIVVVAADDPAWDDIAAALKPLAETRGEPTAWGTIPYTSDADPKAWIDDTFNRLDPIPGFVLLAGSPSHLLFALQSSLASLSYVGRLDFSTVTDSVEQQHPTSPPCTQRRSSETSVAESHPAERSESVACSDDEATADELTHTLGDRPAGGSRSAPIRSKSLADHRAVVREPGRPPFRHGHGVAVAGSEYQGRPANRSSRAASCSSSRVSAMARPQ
jgi:hypothetical protein